GRPPLDHVEDVVERGAGRRRDDADGGGKTRERALALGREQALLLQPGAQPLERQPPQAAGALRLELADDELEVPAPLVERERAEHAYLHALLGLGGQALRLRPEHDAAQARRGVPEREVAVARPVPLPARHLAGHPERRHGAFEEPPRHRVDRRDAVRARRRLPFRDETRRLAPGIVRLEEVQAHPCGPAAVCPSALPAVRRLAASSVLRRSMVMVMGPTPPGTGVIASAISATSSNATSPTRR